MATIDCLYDLPASAGHCHQLVVGINWTLVEGPNGTGLAQTPARNTPGCDALMDAGNYDGRRLKDLAALHQSDNPFECAIAHAAANAHWNQYDVQGRPENGLDLITGDGDGTVLIGRFPGLETKLPKAKVIERNPGPDDYPESATNSLLPKATHLLITGSAIINGSIVELLHLAPNAYTIILGPSTPLCPKLFDLGVNELAGLVVEDVKNTAISIAQGGGIKPLKKYGKLTTIKN